MGTDQIYTGLHSLSLGQNLAENDIWVHVRDAEVLEVGTGPAPKLPHAHQVDGEGCYLTPAFTDIHCHGGAGASFEDTDRVQTIVDAHSAVGTGQMLASLVTNPLEELKHTVAQLAAAIEAQPDNERSVAGIHLEGPYLSPSHRGAHNPAFLTSPTPRQAEELIDAAGGHLKQITLAPETDRDLAALKTFVSAGVRVAVGHTDADYATAAAAFDAGASILTHTYNAMRPMLHRAPGPIAAALDRTHVTLELICDEVHVHAPTMRGLWAMAPGRVALITDAMAAACCHDGHYKLGSLDVEVKDAVARLAEGGAIAGSTLTMARAVETAVACGLPLAEAVAAATVIPARTIGLDAPRGYNLLDHRGRLVHAWRRTHF